MLRDNFISALLITVAFGVAYPSIGIAATSQEDKELAQEYAQGFKDAKKMIGKQYWLSNGLTMLSNKPSRTAPSISPKGALDEFYGPFKILSVIGTEDYFALKILTPEKTIKYMPHYFGGRYKDHDPSDDKPKHKTNCNENSIKLGMSYADVFASCIGKPQRINTTRSVYGEREQWVYKNRYVYFDNGVVTSIQTSQ